MNKTESNGLNRSVFLVFLLILLPCLARSQERPSLNVRFAFEGNKVFSEEKLAQKMNQCFVTYCTKSSESVIFDYCTRELKRFLSSEGYLQATVAQKKQETVGDSARVVLSVQEGRLFYLGQVTINGATRFSPSTIREMLTLNEGDVANADRITEWDKTLKNAYGEFGYIQYTAMVDPNYHSRTGEQSGTVDLNVIIDEGQVFKIKSIRFVAEHKINQDDLRREMFVRVGEVFNKRLFDDSINNLNQSGVFQPIDSDKDVDYQWDRKSPELDIIVHLKKKVA